MKSVRYRIGAWTVAAALGLSLVSGCQTWVPEAGLTLPSPAYLQHPAQYTPPSPPFPLTRELDSLQKAAQQAQDERAAPVGP